MTSQVHGDFDLVYEGQWVFIQTLEPQCMTVQDPLGGV